MTTGKPLSWDEVKKNLDLVKQTAVQQFLAIYRRQLDRPPDELKWGDEVRLIRLKNVPLLVECYFHFRLNTLLWLLMM